MEKDNPNNAIAVAQLKALSEVPGALRIITAERVDPKDKKADLKKPSAWVIHDVVKLEGPDEKGRMVAHSAEGDWATGYPAALLKRLQEANNEVS